MKKERRKYLTHLFLYAKLFSYSLFRMSVSLVPSLESSKKPQWEPSIHIDNKLVLEYLDEQLLNEYVSLRQEYPYDLIPSQDIAPDTWEKMDRIKELESLALKRFRDALRMARENTRERVNETLAA